MNHSRLVIPGRMLLPGFSVYLYCFRDAETAYYYVGMTGDNHYPSARSAIHRLSGHFELQKRSTQNQLNNQILQCGGTDWIKNVEITYCHWPINGFKEVVQNKGKFEPSNLDASTAKAYEAYKARRNQILQLEQYLIAQTKARVGLRCWNKAVKKKANTFPPEFESIVHELLALVV